MFFPVSGPNGEEVYPIRNDGEEGCWRLGKPKMFDIVGRGDADFVPRDDGTFIVYEKIRSTDPRSKPFRSWLTDVGTTADGSKLVKELFDGQKIFPFAKPLALVKGLVKFVANEDENLIIDFFGGSGTTAQAVMELNAEDNGKRKFLCVQINDKVKEDTEAFKASFRTISEITAERIRRASKKIEKELSAGLPLEQKPDLGFKFYRLERSNFKAWSDYQGTNLDELRGLLQEQVSTSFVPDSTEEGILTEILLLEGFPLDSDVSQDETFERNTVWRVSSDSSEHRLFVTLDEEIWEETITNVEELEANDIFICLDKALSDESKIRMSDVCRLKVI